MTKNSSTSDRKKDHIDICINDDVSYKYSNGFDKYIFEHNAITEVVFEEISLQTKFFGDTINYPFMISCMTGGTGEAKFINQNLIEAAKELHIPIGVGSQRQVLENDDYLDSFSIFKNIDGVIPVLANIGAAQVSKLESIDPVKRIIDIVGAKAVVIHCNPLQEIIQKEGEPNFSGLLQAIKSITAESEIPVIVKEVGSGISKNVALKLLNSGVKGIDVAGAGGTSWGAVELVRNDNHDDSYFWNWGLPTSYCIRKVNELKEEYDFTLIASGGINNFDDVAKSIALGADITASARTVLKTLHNHGTDGVISFIIDLFENVKKIMYLTGSSTVGDLQKINLIKKEEIH